MLHLHCFTQQIKNKNGVSSHEIRALKWEGREMPDWFSLNDSNQLQRKYSRSWKGIFLSEVFTLVIYGLKFKILHNKNLQNNIGYIGVSLQIRSNTQRDERNWNDFLYNNKFKAANKCSSDDDSNITMQITQFCIIISFARILFNQYVLNHGLPTFIRDTCSNFCTYCHCNQLSWQSYFQLYRHKSNI